MDEVQFLKDRIFFLESIIQTLMKTKDVQHIYKYVLEDMTILEKKTQDAFAKALSLVFKNVPLTEVKYVCIQLFDHIKSEVIRLHKEANENDASEQLKNDTRIKNFNALQEDSFHEVLIKYVKRNN